MQKIFKTLFIVSCSLFIAFSADAAPQQFLSCGEGYVVAQKGKVDGVDTYECQKLWCHDLENGKSMGSGNKAATGYKATKTPDLGVESGGKHIACFGDRKWCSSDDAGVWNPEFGAYTKKGADSNVYLSAQKGDCYSWIMQKPTCTGDSESAVMVNGEWKCAVAETADNAIRGASIRRTGTVKIR